MNDTARVRINILKWMPMRRMILWPGFPLLLQGIALAGVVWLAMNGFGVGVGVKPDDLMTLRKTNLTTLVVWGLWWPGMIVVAIGLGRAWCTVCPMELVNRLGDSLARRLGWPRARLGAFLGAAWMVVVLYFALQLLVAGVSIHRVPHFTAVLLLTLIGVALLTGLVFREGRSFCKAFCPASALLSVYGRYTPVQLEAHQPSVCDRCDTKDCVRAANRERFDKRSCPSNLVPYRRGPSDGCVLCLQCAKVCPQGNIGFGIVGPSAPVRRKSLLRPFEAAFVMVALGFVTHEVVGEVKWLDSVFHAAPSYLRSFAPAVSFGWWEALWFLVLFPMVVWVVIASAGFVAGHRDGLSLLLLSAATGAAPVVAIAHLSKAAAKIGSWAGFAPLAALDPRGLDTLQRLADRALVSPPPLVSLGTVGWMALVAILLFAWKGWRWASQMPQGSVLAARISLATTTALFSAILMVWIWRPV